MLWHLNIWKLKIWLSEERKDSSKTNQKHFSLSHKCSLFYALTKLAKISLTQPLKVKKFWNVLWKITAKNKNKSESSIKKVMKVIMERDDKLLIKKTVNMS